MARVDVKLRGWFGAGAPGAPGPPLLTSGVVLPVALLIALLVASPAGAASERSLRGEGRLQTSFARDSNVLESTDSDGSSAANALRFLGEARLSAKEMPFGSRAEFSLRGLEERVEDHRRENRRQGEIGLSWVLSAAVSRRRLALDGGYGLRAYPDSSDRGHHRAWGRAAGAVPVGPRGVLTGTVDLFQLDFRRTERTDRVGGGFDLSYEHPWGRRSAVRGGVEVGTVRHGSPALRKLGAGGDGSVYGGDRSDDYRFFHLGYRRTGRLVLQVQAGVRTQVSNSLDGEFDRPEVSWLVSRPLVERVIGQFYGNLVSVSYRSDDLERYLVTRVGEIEAGEDDNAIVLRLARSFGRDWDLDAHLGWYRNEGQEVGVYYRKTVISFGISRRFGSPSGF